ncbi:MAG: hypothetical protein ISR95_02080, partial [Candidatus Marinimicrobia bacterium]|nr:hypothetical protein [Candidatus Neomarinimicrobiota bacterium]
MVEAVDNDGWDGSDWGWAENNYFEVNIQPLSYGYFTIYIRAAASNQESWTNGWTYVPSSSSYTDCLGYPAYRIRVYVQQPNNPPNQPYNEDPYDGEQNVSINHDLDWSCSDPDGDNLDYYVYFGTDPTPDSGEYQGIATGSSYLLPTLNYSTHYYWKIIAFDPGGLETSSPVWDFYTEDAPEVNLAQWHNTSNQQITSAYACQTVRLYIETTGYSNGTTFTTKIYEDNPGGDDFITDGPNITINSSGTGYGMWTVDYQDDWWLREQEIDSTRGDPEYYFKVYYSEAEEKKSGNLDVTDPTDPNDASLSSPSNGQEFEGGTQNISFNWSWSDTEEQSCGSGLDHYECWIDDNSGFSSPNTNNTGTTSSHTENLGVGQFYWKVRVYDVAENYTDSEIRNFTIGPDETP